MRLAAYLPRRLAAALACLLGALSGFAATPDYRTETGVVYATVDGTALTLNSFVPRQASGPTAAMVHIHGGWWSGGHAIGQLRGEPFNTFARRGLAVFSIEYRLGRKGGFPPNIRDCRNAVRFVRANAPRFNVDPRRIACCGGSAGAHLSMMVAMVPEGFDDGGPVPELQDVSARVCGAFAWNGPTDLLRQWRDSVAGKPSNARPYHRVLFKGVEPDTPANEALYLRMSPLTHVRAGLPPLLICDGGRDPIVPGQPGKTLHEQLQKVGVDSRYWVTPAGGHGYPRGQGFPSALASFLDRIFAPASPGTQPPNAATVPNAD